MDVYERIGLDLGWSFDVAGHAGCQWLGLDAVSGDQQGIQFDVCRSWREQVNELVRSENYDAVLVVGTSREYLIVPEGMQSYDYEMQVYLEAWSNRRDPAELPIVALRDYPLFGPDQMLCLEEIERISAGQCSVPREQAVRDSGLLGAVDRAENAYLIDINDYICGPEVCDQIVGGVVVSRDDGLHLTRTFASTLKPYFQAELLRVLGP